LTQIELEKVIDSRTEAKIAEAKETILKEVGPGLDSEKLKAAVDVACKKIIDDAAKEKGAQSNYLEQFEKAAFDSASKSVNNETKESVCNQMIASALFSMEKTGQKNICSVAPEAILAAAKEKYPDSKALHGVLQTKKELSGSIPSSGGFTIPTAFSADYIKALYAKTLLEKLGAKRVPMPNGNFSIPRMDSTAAVSWVGETSRIPATSQTFGEVNLKAKKLSCLVALSNSLLRYSGVGLESWIVDDMTTKARNGLDAAAIYGSGTAYTPLGLENVTGVQTTGTSSTAFGLSTPIDMIALLEEENIPMENVKWLLNPTGKSWIMQKAFSSGPWAWGEEMIRSKTLGGYEFLSSSTIKNYSSKTYADFWLGDFSQFIWGVGYDISIEMSREGSYFDGTNTVSAFTNDLTLIRLITEHDFAARQPKAFVKGTFSKS